MNPAPVAVERNTKTATAEWLRLRYFELRVRRCDSKFTAPRIPQKMTLNPLNLLNPNMIHSLLDQLKKLCWHGFGYLS